ncbi:MAG: hypothetical protein ACTSR8_06425 [Promethearchaeota archaeon]
MNLLKDTNKLYIAMIIPTLIIAIILFSIEFTMAPEPPYISLLGFGLLIGSGTFIYFTNMKKLKETKEEKEAIKAYLLPSSSTLFITNRVSCILNCLYGSIFSSY